MQILNSIHEMSRFSEDLRRKGTTIGLVPTMGALHEGHLSLIQTSVKECTVTVASIFVNPTQFEAGEDLDRYPRKPEADAGLLARNGCGVLLTLDEGEMYPKGFQTWVAVEKLQQPLCGQFRPTHFRGVATVVAKLFNIVRPHRAYFGWKDAQQALLIKRMAQDLNFGIEISIQPTIRDKDGLALSSRNSYLSVEEKKIALLIPEGIRRAREYFKKGQKDAKLLMDELYSLFKGQKETRVDYISLVRMDDLEEVDEITRDTMLALAVRVGSTRLIDNHRFAED